MKVAAAVVRRHPKQALAVVRSSNVSGLFDKLKKGLGLLSTVAPVMSPTMSLAMQALKYANARKQQAASKPRTQPALASSEDQEILAGGCGDAETGAMARQRSPFYFPAFISVGADVPNDVYRAAIWKRACLVSKKAGGNGRPDAKHVFLAKKATDWDLKRKGISVSIPGARPGRSTERQAALRRRTR